MMDHTRQAAGAADGAQPSTWVLLRGLTREARHWGDFPHLLGDEVPGARVVAIDLPGNGGSNHLRSPTRISDMTQACRERLRAEGHLPPYHLLAMSLGGMVAADWVHRCPADVSGAVLINTSLRPFSPWYARLRPSNLGVLLQLVLAGSSARDKESKVLALTSRHAGSSDAVLEDWVNWRSTHPVSAANALRQLLAAARYRAPRQAPRPQVLVLYSALDGLVNPRCSCDLARAWAATILAHPSAGHDLPLDDGPWVIRQISRWLAGSDDGVQ